MNKYNLEKDVLYTSSEFPNWATIGILEKETDISILPLMKTFLEELVKVERYEDAELLNRKIIYFKNA